jgi:hypothetical protein
MKLRYRLFRKKSGIFFLEDSVNRKQESLKTREKTEALRLLHARNEAHQQPAINLQIARAYLMASDPMVATRTWQHVLDAIIQTKHGATRTRWEWAARDKAFDRIRNTPLFETQAGHLLGALQAGTVSTNVHLRKLHNFAVAMNWLPTPVLPRKQWPALVFKPKRAITVEEHNRILARERNPERRNFYSLCWCLGGSQSDIASLLAEDINWEEGMLAYRRKKTDTPVLIRFGGETAAILRSLPSSGPLFPGLSGMHEKHRAAFFRRRCLTLGISGVSLHSYRYAWAERAKACGYPERFAQQALGHNSAAVHRAYAKKAQVKLPSLEEYENKIVPLPTAAGI